MNFIALDFETANRQPNSACSLALVVVRDNKIVNHFYTLIDPEAKFDYWNTKVNGLTSKSVAGAPNFAEVWPHIAPLFSMEQLMVAHNARFDTKVLQESLRKYKIEPPHFLTLDTVKTTRKFYPDLPNYRLNTVSDYLQIKLTQHHHALADSYACAEILINETEQFGTSALKKMVLIA
ncbi:3'-5' exonuclease [Lapidilactobacillus gannanensis]|jgi:DNA polymerase-3 subunit epsilon|uniref:3'-5' exonuclease n=1 Tax=Lapidilactobacillus gannanensis TaxID=2486002 RepID=A0ABW4BNM3_9LACO|nr:3'-5' exonuclease [Lapidilactobacillus gannanensis]MCH4057697.1 3'-5' exonuclease [Lactobacillaceae bacterium]